MSNPISKLAAAFIPPALGGSTPSDTPISNAEHRSNLKEIKFKDGKPTEEPAFAEAIEKSEAKHPEGKFTIV